MFKLLVLFMSINGNMLGVDTELLYTDLKTCDVFAQQLQKEYKPLLVHGSKLMDVRAVCKKV